MSTIRDVAARAQVSIATVSRVINNDTQYKITPQTRERVWQAVAELNYHAPAMPKKEERSSTPANFRRVGCVLNLQGGKYTDPYYLSLLSGVESYLGEHRCEVCFVRTRNELAERETLLRTFRDKIDGLILMHPLEEKTYQYVKEQVRAIVGVDSGYPDIDNVGYDHFQVAQMGVRRLYQAGYREIGFIGSHDRLDPMSNSERFIGYTVAMRQLKLSINPEWVIDCKWMEGVCARKVEELHNKSRLPRAFFVSSDLMAMAALRCLYNLGLNVPKDVAVMGLTNIEMSKYSNPPLTTIHIPTDEIGRIAAKTLIDRMDGDDTLPKRIILPSKLIERNSI